MSHSIRAPGPIQFKICRKTPAKGFWKMFSWLRDIINNSKLLMSSSPQPSLSILVYTIQEKDSLAIKCVQTTCQLSRFPETGKLFSFYTERNSVIMGQLHVCCSVTIRQLYQGYKMRAKIENGSMFPFRVVESAASARPFRNIHDSQDGKDLVCANQVFQPIETIKGELPPSLMIYKLISSLCSLLCYQGLSKRPIIRSCRYQTSKAVMYSLNIVL